MTMEDIPSQRKHSSGDLHSRLKTRKLLGVGETDDGDVHRSKLSQILGHSDQLYTRLPRGLRLWQLVLSVMFTGNSLWALFLPQSFYKFTMHLEADHVVVFPIRLYGTALLSFSLVFWGILKVVDKELIRWALLSSIVYFISQILVSMIYSLSLSFTTVGGFMKITMSSAACAFNAYYYWQLGLPASQYNSKAY